KYLFKFVPFDEKFLLVLTPYIVFGIALRMMVDVGIFEKSKYWNVTPGVHIVSSVFAVTAIGIGLLINKYTGRPYWHFPLIIGSIGAAYFLIKLTSHMIHPERILYSVALASSITLVIYVVSGFFDVSEVFRTKENVIIIFSHILDGSATFVGINLFHFTEEHILPEFLINMAGGNAVIMIPLKIVVILLALYIIEKWYLEELEAGEDIQTTENYYKMFKFIFFILGAGPGLRDALLPTVI
ncbi:MAG: DUF63 family protein, partial [Candidatus Hydrothermarchaeales archaeon]